MTNYDWAQLLLIYAGLPTTYSNVLCVVRWMCAENPPSYWWQDDNPLNVADFDGAGLYSFASLHASALASAQVLEQANMIGIYSVLAEGNCGLDQFSEAAAASPWSSAHYNYPLFIASIPLPAAYTAPGSGPYYPPVAKPVTPPAPIVIIKPIGGKVGKLNAPVVAVVSTGSGKGYTLVAADGGTFNYGDAPFLGSLGNTKLNAPIVDAARTNSGRGLIMVGTDGGVFCFGDAVFEGSMGGQKLNEPVVSVSMSPDDKGYWLTAADGGVFAFGDSAFHGSPA